MPWMPGIPHDQGDYPRAALRPVAGILHRTIGHWAGDYQIGKHGRGPGDPDKTGFHFLVGQAFGQVVQFYETDVVSNHAAGANTWAVGIEFSGQNGEPLTDWQVAIGGEIVRWLDTTHKIPPTFYDGPRKGEAPGWRGHVSVATSPSLQHVDTITRAEFDRLVAAPAPNPVEVLMSGYNLVAATWVPSKNCAIGVDREGHVFIAPKAVGDVVYNGGYTDGNNGQPLGPPCTDFVGITADATGYTIIHDNLVAHPIRWKK